MTVLFTKMKSHVYVSGYRVANFACAVILGCQTGLISSNFHNCHSKCHINNRCHRSRPEPNAMPSSPPLLWQTRLPHRLTKPLIGLLFPYIYFLFRMHTTFVICPHIHIVGSSSVMFVLEIDMLAVPERGV